MALRYEKQFAGHEAEIIRDVCDKGTFVAMYKWEAEDYIAWSRYLDKIRGKPLTSANDNALTAKPCGAVISSNPINISACLVSMPPSVTFGL